MAIVGDAVDVLLTLAEAKAHPGINGDDADLQRYIDAVSELIEELCGPVVPRVETETVTTYGTVLLDRRVLSVDSVTLDNLPVTDYRLRAKAGLLIPTYLTSLYGSTITYTVGLSPIPEPIRLAALYGVKHAAESDDGAAVNGEGVEVFTLSRGEFLTPRVEELLAPYRRRSGVS